MKIANKQAASGGRPAARRLARESYPAAGSGPVAISLPRHLDAVIAWAGRRFAARHSARLAA